MAETLPLRFGSYILLRRLGRGSSGDVCLARPRDEKSNLPKLLVVKRMHAALVENEELVKRFAHEARLAAKIDSPHVARVFDAGYANDLIFIAMEYIPGWSLVNVLHRLHEEKRPTPIGSARTIMVHALRGLEALHSAVDPKTRKPLDFVHRDIAPKNIMLGDDGLTRLIDLGLGRSSLKDWQTQTGMVMGSVGYMPPEQVLAKQLDVRTDLYAMGVVLFETLTGRPYIPVGNQADRLKACLRPQFRKPSAFRPDLPVEIDAVAKKALRVTPERRFQSAAEFRVALESALPETDTDTAGTLVSFLLRDEEVESRTELMPSLALPEADADPTQPGVSEALIVRAKSNFSNEDLFAATAPEADPAELTAPDTRLEVSDPAETPELATPASIPTESSTPTKNRRYSLATLVILSAAVASAAATVAIMVDRQVRPPPPPVETEPMPPNELRAVRGKDSPITAKRTPPSRATLIADRIAELDRRAAALESAHEAEAKAMRATLGALAKTPGRRDVTRRLRAIETRLSQLER